MSTQREYVEIYALYAPELRTRTKRAGYVLSGTGVAGLVLLFLGIVSHRVLLAAMGAGFLLISVTMALKARPMAHPRMLVLRGRVLELEEGSSESGAEVVIELSSVKRLRPDGMMRALPIERARQKLGIADSVYDELRARHGGEVELLAGNDSFVVASLEGARRRLDGRMGGFDQR
jgi:hypothetical protein